VQAWQFPHGYNETAEERFAGFVYLITNTVTGRAYIGRKAFKSKIKGNVRPSNWRVYHGSCKPLKADIKALGADRFTRRVISLHRTNAEMNYAEIEAQFVLDVLNATLPDGSRAFYNSNIMARWFAA